MSFADFADGRSGARFSDWLRVGAEPFWTQATEHRFTREIAADTLADETYGRYLVQDYLFLDVLARLLGHAVAAAPGMPPKARLAGFLAAVTSEENDYFLRSFAALGIAEEAWREAEAAPVTRRLGEVMLGAARDGGYAECLAVLLPAEWIYLSWATAAAGPKPARFYLREWIELHADPGFLAFVGWLCAEMDRHGADLPPERQTRVAALFREVAELEVGFFDAAYSG